MVSFKSDLKELQLILVTPTSSKSHPSHPTKSKLEPAKQKVIERRQLWFSSLSIVLLWRFLLVSKILFGVWWPPFSNQPSKPSKRCSSQKEATIQYTLGDITHISCSFYSLHLFTSNIQRFQLSLRSTGLSHRLAGKLPQISHHTTNLIHLDQPLPETNHGRLVVQTPHVAGDDNLRRQLFEGLFLFNTGATLCSSDFLRPF